MNEYKYPYPVRAAFILAACVGSWALVLWVAGLL